MHYQHLGFTTINFTLHLKIKFIVEFYFILFPNLLFNFVKINL